MTNGIKILVVEDVIIAQKLTKLILEELGCDVDIAENGQKALRFFKEKQYDIVFVDLGLPDIDGFNVAAQMRELESGQQHVIIVALTANFDESHRHHCLKCGMDEFMLKPLTKEKGLAVLKKVINKNEPEDFFSNFEIK